MYEKGAAIRRQRQKEAAAWMEVNRGRIGIPSEIENCRIIGKLDHPIISDGWDNLHWRFQGAVTYTSLNKKGEWSNGGKDRIRKERRSTFNKAENRRRVYDRPGQLVQCISVLNPLGRFSGFTKYGIDHRGIRKECRQFEPGEKVKPDVSLKKTIEKGYFPRSILEGFRQVASSNGFRISWPDGERIVGIKAKQQALREVATGGLKKATVLVGERIPKHLKLRKYDEVSERQQRRDRVMRIGDLFTAEQLGDMNPEEMIMDDKRLEIIAVEELWDLLRSNGLTVKEAEALDCRAYGQRSNSRLLMRGQMKARRILGGPIVIRSWKRPHVEWLHQLSACWVAV